MPVSAKTEHDAKDMVTVPEPCELAKAQMGLFDPQPPKPAAATSPAAPKPPTAAAPAPAVPKPEGAVHYTKTPEFKRWFGDWEQEPHNASKVVHPETGEPLPTHEIPGTGSKVTGADGKPIVVYHGTAHGGFRGFDKGKQDPDALYGPGFYFTEDPNVAKQYEGKDPQGGSLSRDVTDDDVRRAHEFGERDEHAGKFMRTHFPDAPAWVKEHDGRDDPGKLGIFLRGALAHRSRPDPSRAHFQDTRTAAGITHAESDAAQARIADHLGINWVEPPAPETKAVHLNIRKPVDMDKPDPDLAEELVRREGQHLGYWTKGQWKNNLRKARENPASTIGVYLSGRHLPRVAKAFEDLGYDGITHIGGDRAGGGHHHRVWIAFEPHQIKHVENEGTWDPANPDMYKASPEEGLQLVKAYRRWSQSVDETEAKHGDHLDTYKPAFSGYYDPKRPPAAPANLARLTLRAARQSRFGAMNQPPKPPQPPAAPREMYRRESAAGPTPPLSVSQQVRAVADRNVGWRQGANQGWHPPTTYRHETWKDLDGGKHSGVMFVRHQSMDGRDRIEAYHNGQHLHTFDSANTLQANAGYGAFFRQVAQKAGARGSTRPGGRPGALAKPVTAQRRAERVRLDQAAIARQGMAKSRLGLDVDFDQFLALCGVGMEKSQLLLDTS